MHPEHIKAELRIRGSSFAAVARALGCSRTAVTNAVTGGKRSKPIERHIARILAMPVSEVFPDRYAERAI